MPDPVTALQQRKSVDKAFLHLALHGKAETLAEPLVALLGPIDDLDPLERDILADPSGTRYPLRGEQRRG